MFVSACIHVYMGYKAQCSKWFHNGNVQFHQELLPILCNQIDVTLNNDVFKVT